MARKYGGPRGYGHVPDPAGHQVTSFNRLRARIGASPLPPEASIAASAPAVMNQGSTSSCVGHATGAAIVTSFVRAGRPLAILPSPKGIYDVARCIDRIPNIDGSLPPLTDDGCQPNQAMRGLAEWGIRPMGPRPADGRNSDADPTTIDDEPTLGDLEADSALQLVGEYRIDTLGSQRVDDLCRALAAGYAVCFAALVGVAFEDWSPASGPIGAPDPHDFSASGHYLYAIGYRTDPATRGKVIRFRNSWGPGWGLGGDGEGDEAFIASLTDIYVMSINGSMVNS